MIVLIPWNLSLVAAAADAPPEIEVADDGTWLGTIALVNSWSADDRMLALADGDDIDVRPLPLPVTVQYVTGRGHDGATVGLMSVDEVWRDGPRVMGGGRIDMDDPQGPALARKIRKQFFRFVSADIDRAEGEMVCATEDGTVAEDGDLEACEDVRELYTRWRIMGASLLAHPAFPEAQIGMADPAPADPAELTAAAEDGPTHAGVAVKAVDTGRVLLIQRALDDDDPAAGRWEFPGGSIEDGEDPQAAAFREFAEETGAALPDTVTVVDGWRSENGVYQGYVATIPEEADINPDPDERAVLNPDDPDGDRIEVVAWWDIDALPEMPALREEARETPWELLVAAGSSEEMPAVVTAGAATLAVDTDLPWAPRDREWDGDAAHQRVAEWATGEDGELNPARMQRAFLVVDDPPENLGSYRFGVADVIDGELHLVWNGVTAAYAALEGARSEPDLTGEQRDSALRQVGALYRAAAEEFDDPSIAELPGAGETEESMTAAVHVEGWTPPTEWFRDPTLAEPQPIQVDDDGRVFGHLAAWNVPHRSFPGRDIMAPRSPSGYALFNSRPVATSEGLVDVGLITMGTGHAALGLDRRAAAEHYDNTGTMAAVVRAGEDAHGIWVAGAALPWLTDEERLRLSLSRFSGDWRQEGSGLELVAALAVNTEGFPVPEKRAGRDAEDYALIAAGALPPARTSPEPGSAEFGQLVEAVTAEQERRAQLASRVGQAAAKVRQVRVRMAARRVRSLRVKAIAAADDGEGAGGFASNNLEDYWKRGKGAAKIRWGTPGDWTRCHRELTEHVGDERARRICSQWHHDVTGLWPGDRDNP